MTETAQKCLESDFPPLLHLNFGHTNQDVVWTVAFAFPERVHFFPGAWYTPKVLWSSRSQLLKEAKLPWFWVPRDLVHFCNLGGIEVKLFAQLGT